MKIILLIFPLLILLCATGYAASVKEDYELQERCGKRAEELFEKFYGKGISNDKDGSMLSNYTCHYNKKLNKCFVLLTSISIPKAKDGNTIRIKSLYDINENKEYADLSIANDKPITCKAIGNFCRTESEWDLLVRPYMEE